MNTRKRLAAVVLTALVLVSCLSSALAAPNVEVSGSADVVITALSASHSTGADAGAVQEGDSRAVMTADLSRPGAWACFTIGVENRGDCAAVLSQVLQQDDTPADLLISFGISNADAGELLAPGETCTVTIVAQVDPSLTASTLAAEGSFALTLVYDAAADSPKTGDSTPALSLFLLMALSLAALVLLKKHRAN